MNPERRGLFVVLEGSDGSGKGTQYKLLGERLKAVGYDVALYDFPRYELDSSHFVKEYLNGQYGPAAEISPYMASLFYALDRYDASRHILKDLAAGRIVLANRYVGSNMAHQGSKFTDDVEQRGFFVWNDNLEYELLKLPRPDVSIFLRVPAETSFKLIEQKAKRSYTDSTRDEHEADLNHLKRAVATYDTLCRLFPKDFKAIDCVKDDKLLSIAQISDLIWKSLQPLLPADKPKPSHSAVVTLDPAEPPASKFTADDSPERLTAPFKSSSLLLRRKIEAVYPGSTVPQIGFWADSKYQYYTPPDIPADIQPSYEAIMAGLADKQRQLTQGLRQYYERHGAKSSDLNGVSYLTEPVTPLAAILPFEAVINKSEVLPLCRRLLDVDLTEAQQTAKQLYLTARQVWPTEFKRPLETSEPVTPIGSIIAKMASSSLSPTDNNQTVKMLESAPRQEFNLLAESIYTFSSLPLNEIAAEVTEWSYQQKYDSLRRAASQPNLLSQVRYKMDVVSDQISMYRVAQTAGLRHIQTQAISPRYGFDVPQIFEDADLDDLYNDCFDESLRLYSLLQAAGREDLAAYAALSGHKVRWQLNVSAAGLLAAAQKQTTSGDLIASIMEAVSEHHPLLWQILTQEAERPPKSLNRVKPSHRRRSTKPKKS